MITTPRISKREPVAFGGRCLLPALLVIGLALLGGSSSHSRPVAVETRPGDRQALTPLQPLIDSAPAGSVLRPPPGRYAGPVILRHPLTIDGGGLVTIDAAGQGTVITLESGGATLRSLHLTGSGASHDGEDACLRVRGNGNTLENLVLDDCLFGIDLKQADDHIVRGNRIRSKPLALGIRGDGIRLWYARRNLIERNEVVDSKTAQAASTSCTDAPHQELVHADRLWRQMAAARFFKSAPALELLDFLERLAPFVPPEILFRDDSPRFSRAPPA